MGAATALIQNSPFNDPKSCPRLVAREIDAVHVGIRGLTPFRAARLKAAMIDGAFAIKRRCAEAPSSA